MAELGAGSGTGYPSAIDSDVTVETTNDYARIQVANDLAAAIVAIETELGISPSGGYATVLARLNALSASGGGVASGLSSARPAASAGVFYYSTDLGVLDFSDGTTWRPILTG